MSKQTDNSLLIVSSMPRFYQQLLSGVVSYEALGERIVKAIKLHHAFRHVDKVRELGQILVNFPIKEYRLIGQYYLLWCGCRENKYHARILEAVIEQSQTYKAKALQSRAAFEVYEGNPAQALYFYTESFKARPSVSEYIETIKAIAYVKAVEGFHKSALKDLESLIPILRHAEPFAYYDILNSLAVELGESGRKQEAYNISRLVLASPFAHAYPEWRETADDLKLANRSLVALNPRSYVPHKVLSMPAREIETTEQSQQAKLFSLKAWKRKMAKKKEPPPKHEGDMLMRIISIFSSDETNDYERHRIYEAVEKIIAERYNPKPDDDGA